MHFEVLLNTGHWFEILPGPPSPFYLVVVAAFLAWTATSVYLYSFRRKTFLGNGALIGVVARFGPYAIAVGITGLFLLAMRFVEFPYLSMRFLLYLTILSAIGYLGFLVYYMYRRYPNRVAEVRAHDLRRRYAPERKRRKRR